MNFVAVLLTRTGVSTINSIPRPQVSFYSFVLPRCQTADDLIDDLADSAVTHSRPSVQMPGSLFGDGDFEGHETFVIVLFFCHVGVQLFSFVFRDKPPPYRSP